MGVLDFLFGGNQDVKTKTEPWKEQQPYLLKGFKEAESLYNAPGPTYFPGDTIADFNQNQAQSQRLGARRALLGNDTMGMAEDYTQGILGGQYLNNPYADSVFSNIQSKVMPSVNSIFSNAGRYGSGSHADSAARGLTEAYAPVAAQMYEQGLSRMDNAARFAPTFAANDYADINALNAVGQQQQDQSQREIDAQVARYNFGQDQPANKLGQYMGFIGGTGYGSTTSGQQYQGGIIPQIIGTALGAYASSDYRRKENIRRVGTLNNGLPVYSYRYKDGGPVQIGVIAQDVEKVKPDAVITGPGGFKYVNYQLATE